MARSKSAVRRAYNDEERQLQINEMLERALLEQRRTAGLLAQAKAAAATAARLLRNAKRRARTAATRKKRRRVRS